MLKDKHIATNYTPIWRDLLTNGKMQPVAKILKSGPFV